jgi:DNA (cytosine-5)-methyltransferase 1
LTGGFSYAAQQVWGDDLEIVAFCEIDKFCQKVLHKHWPDVKIVEDIKDLHGKEFEGVDLITGGFPCQDLSICRKKQGFSGKRSSLYIEMLRIISESRPRFVIFENVSNLIAGEYGRWFARFLYDLAEVGYDAQWNCIPASSINAPHIRDRIWIVAYPSEHLHIEPQKSFGWAIARQLRGTLIRGDKNRSWQPEPNILRMVNGLPNQLDRLKSLGNAIVPQVAMVIMQAIKEIEENIYAT